jgi:hypothetical protein
MFVPFAEAFRVAEGRHVVPFILPHHPLRRQPVNLFVGEWTPFPCAVEGCFDGCDRGRRPIYRLPLTRRAQRFDDRVRWLVPLGRRQHWPQVEGHGNADIPASTGAKDQITIGHGNIRW